MRAGSRVSVTVTSAASAGPVLVTVTRSVARSPASSVAGIASCRTRNRTSRSVPGAPAPDALGLDPLGLDPLGLDPLGLDPLGLDPLGPDPPG
ncbi:hypothetical protein GCM10009734_03550 [Nonomuraea bangladeshensis]